MRSLHPYIVLAAICLLGPVFAQVSVTDATAGVSPNTENPTYANGQNGLSTGSTVQFQQGSTGATPSQTRQTLTLTGAALSAYEASINSAYLQGLGSNGAYTLTTGNQIPGVAATLSGGYNEQQSTQAGGGGSSSSGSSSRQGDGALSVHYAPSGLFCSTFINAFMAFGLLMFGAAIVL